ncbi:MAG: hypothetical protein WCI47_00010 [bacterium]
MGLIDETSANKKIRTQYPRANAMLDEAMQQWRKALKCEVNFYARKFDETDTYATFNETIIEIDGILVHYRWSIMSDLHAWYVFYIDVESNPTVLRAHLVSAGTTNYGADARKFRKGLGKVVNRYGRTSLDNGTVRLLLKLQGR